MIPNLNLSGVLPPYVGSDPTVFVGTSPYETSMLEVARAFATSRHRQDLVRDLIRYRDDLRAIGTPWAIQLIDGSFCEDVEATRGTPPSDIDLVTLLARPPHLQADADWQNFVSTRPDLFVTANVKAAYRCDAYFIEAGLPAGYIWKSITYWFGLFSHQRATFLWKGMLAVPLHSNDVDAVAYLDSLGAGP